MLPMSDKAIMQQNKLRRLREEMMQVNCVAFVRKARGKITVFCSTKDGIFVTLFRLTNLALHF
jgi:hypothetical protein